MSLPTQFTKRATLNAYAHLEHIHKVGVGLSLQIKLLRQPFSDADVERSFNPSDRLQVLGPLAGQAQLHHHCGSKFFVTFSPILRIENVLKL